ncbi:carbon-nitrogen hydrolase family protein [Rhizobium leguminosarum]|uniref:carbon-nitrogen hydrolase family protein n=1 Tax=Rhizobium leguminosarum TaxID=384 RepID=UPI001C918FD3|nr:carbon-nitrogen hydrolase family protein [Rhizobium leguminosarum]MBY3026469.1 carbon-nitrogen hydrolase family protein [Rhizobium leguminosarum]
MKIALVQMSSQPDRAYNLAEAARLMREAMIGRPDLIMLPEHFDWLGGTVADKRRAADRIPGGEAYVLVQRFAKDNAVWVHAGSLMERRGQDHRVYNTTVVFNAKGEEVGLYRKIHLFDITAPDGKTYSESAAVAPGRDLFIYELDGHRIGCAICYDLRFSRLFDRLAEEKVDIFVLPAAFTYQTGQAHWEVLCRARAIEFQAYFAACGQCGSYAMPDGELRRTFGHSMVCDPWGQIVARAENDVCVLVVEIDPARLPEVRRLIPMAEHRVLLADRQVRLSPGTKSRR